MMLLPDNKGNFARLRMDEAVLLCHVLTSHIAVQAGLRVVFIKGPVAVLQGLRKPKQSVDVDVLVEPGAVRGLVEALQERGWELRPAEPDTEAFPRHSETLFHRSWPVDIDVHYRFPGMEDEPEACFEAMWKASISFELAGHQIRVPTRSLAVCILALHSLRTPSQQSSKAELSHLASLDLQEDSHSIIAIARQTGAMAALRPFITVAFGEEAVASVPKPSAEWSRRTGASAPGTSRAIALMSAPWHRKPRLVFNAIFPSKATLLAKNIYADVSFSGRFRLYVARWQTLLRSLPEFMEDVKRYLTSR